MSEIKLKQKRKAHSEETKKKMRESALNREKPSHVTHGFCASNPKLYAAWQAMRERCNNSHRERYGDYGGRGIKVCDEWMDKEHGVENFVKWCSESGYRKGLTIERIDNDGDYCPENCKWATKAEQSCNKRNTILVLYNGIFVPISKMASETGLEHWKIRHKVKNGEIPYIRGGFPKEQN